MESKWVGNSPNQPITKVEWIKKGVNDESMKKVKRKLQVLQNRIEKSRSRTKTFREKTDTRGEPNLQVMDLPLVTMIDDQVIKQLNQVQKDLMEGMDSHETKDRPNQLNKKLIDLENKREALEKELVVKKAMIENQKREFNEKLKTLINGLGIKNFNYLCDGKLAGLKKVGGILWRPPF